MRAHGRRRDFRIACEHGDKDALVIFHRLTQANAAIEGSEQQAVHWCVQPPRERGGGALRAR